MLTHNDATKANYTDIYLNTSSDQEQLFPSISVMLDYSCLKLAMLKGFSAEFKPFDTQ